MSIRRRSSTAVVLVLAVPMSLTGVAWACAPSNWGWTPPDTPEATAVAPRPAPAPAQAPAPTAQPSAPLTPVVEQPPAPVAELIESPVRQSASSGSTEAVRKRSAQPARSSARQPARSAATLRPGAAARLPTVAANAAVAASSPRSAPTSANAAKTAARPKGTTAQPKPATTARQANSGRWAPPAAAPAAGLLPRAGDPASLPGSAADVRPLFGAALLGLGLVAMFGAFALVEPGRRRVSARTSRSRDRARR